MKAMIWKEWRENAKWAALAFLALGLATIYVTTQDFGSRSSQPSPNLFDMTAPLTLFLVPIFATALGLMQVNTELRRDQWAFLMHRPVSRTTIFAGKAIAGISLYAIAAVTPMVILALWMQTPGAIAAPFDWHLLLAPIANILAGVTFYFAGMLAAVRSARWYGSRAIGFAVAAGCLLLVNAVPEFWQALLAVLLLVALLGLAAWGSFLTTGTYDRQPRLAKIALGTTLFASIALVVGFITMLAISTISQRQRSAIFANRRAYSGVQYGIDKTGRILRIKFTEGMAATASDLQGHVIPLPESRQFSTLQKGYLITPWSGSGRDDFRSTNRYYLSLSESDYYSGENDKIAWYWLKAQKRAVAYSRTSRYLIGSIGPQGFMPTESGLAAPFAEPLFSQGSQNMIGTNFSEIGGFKILRFPHSLYALNLKGQRVKHLYTSTSQQAIQGAASISYGFSTQDAILAVADKNLVSVFKGDKLLFSNPLEVADTKDVAVNFLATSKNDRFFLWYELPGDNNSPNNQAKVEHISEFSSKGVLIAKHALPDLSKFQPNYEYHQFWYEAAAPALEVPPVAMGALYVLETWSERTNPPKHKASNEFNVGKYLIGTLLVSLVLSPLAFFTARRADLSPLAQRGWTLTVVALGLFGLLLLLALHEWTARVDCPSCGKKRSVNRDYCQHCGAPFPAALIDETSIFEDSLEEGELMRSLAHA